MNDSDSLEKEQVFFCRQERHEVALKTFEIFDKAKIKAKNTIKIIPTI